MKRQYYYRMDHCKANDSDAPDCVCWHDEGTGPMADVNDKMKSWRDAPAVTSTNHPGADAATVVTSHHGVSK